MSTGHIRRRLEKLEIQAAAIDAANQQEPHTLVFVGRGRRPVSVMRWDREKQVWGNLDLSNENARREFEKT